MKRFLTGVLATAVFFTGLAAIVEKAAAGFKSDDKALEIIKKARTAIGGDAALAGVQSMVIKGQTSTTLSIDGADRIEQGDTEIAFQLPDKMMKMVKIGKGEPGAEADVEKVFDVIVTGGDLPPVPGEGKKIVIRKMNDAEAKDAEAGEAKVFVRKVDGQPGDVKIVEDVNEVKTADGKKFTIVRKGGEGEATFKTDEGNVMFERQVGGPHEGRMRQNELLRTTLALLVTAPQGLDVSYTYAGDSNLDGVAVSAVVASFGGASYKLYFDQSSYLPVAMSFKGHAAPVMFKVKKEGGDPNAKADVVTFNRKIDMPAGGVENFVRFSDFRSTNGVQLPYKWTTSVGGKVTEVFDVTSYEVNPSNIGDRFSNQKVMVRKMAKDQN